MLGLRPFLGGNPIRPWVCASCSSRIPQIRERPRIRYPRCEIAGYASAGSSVDGKVATFTRDGAQAAGDAKLAAQEGTKGWRSKPRKRRRRLIGFATFGVTLYALVNYTEDGHKAWVAARRTGRVIATLAVNIQDYRKVLKQREDTSITKEVYNANLKACHKRCAERTLRTMEANGSIFIKLGQHLTSLNYLLPPEWCDTFIPLQDKCPVTPFSDIKAMVESDTQQPFSTLFTDFSEEPLGAASLAQVHLATDARSGQRVAVKAQHPVLDDWAPLDLALTRFTFRTLKRAFPAYDLTWLSDEMQVSLPQELNFELEGANAKHCKSYFEPLTTCPLVVPSVLWAKRRILVMEYMTGHRLDDLNYLSSHNIDRDEVSAALSRIFNTMIFAPGAPLHCDPHGGNIAIRANPSRRTPPTPHHPHGKTQNQNFDIILYDHGLYREIPRKLQRDYAKLWLAVLDADIDGMREASKAVAGISDEQFPLFASAITGRDYRAVTANVSQTPRSEAERQAMSDALGEGLLQELVGLLGQVPRIILLVLKTNDLTRSLDAKLQTRRGPMRSFLILARYAAQTVLEEQKEILRRVAGYVWWPPRNAVRLVGAYAKYGVVVGKLGMFELWLWVRGVVGLSNEMPGGHLMEGSG